MAAATASGLIALLEEPSLELRAHALRSLNQVTPGSCHVRALTSLFSPFAAEALPRTLQGFGGKP